MNFEKFNFYVKTIDLKEYVHIKYWLKFFTNVFEQDVKNTNASVKEIHWRKASLQEKQEGKYMLSIKH